MGRANPNADMHDEAEASTQHWLEGFEEESPWCHLPQAVGDADWDTVLEQASAFLAEAHDHHASASWWDTVKATEAARLLLANLNEHEEHPAASTIAAEAALLQGLALEKLGLTHAAERRYVAAASRSHPAASRLAHVTAARIVELAHALEACSTAAVKIEASQHAYEVLEEEMQRLAAGVGEGAVSWAEQAVCECASEKGRVMLFEAGLLKADSRVEGGGGRGGGGGSGGRIGDQAMRRAVMHATLLHAARRRLSEVTAAAAQCLGLLEQDRQFFVAPEMLQRSDAVAIFGEAARRSQDVFTEALLKDRFAILDGAIPQQLIPQLRSELQQLRRAGTLRADPHDLCNPGNISGYLPLQTAELRANLSEHCPLLACVCARLMALPVLLQTLLPEALPSNSLSVPMTVLASCYPPGAYYKEHLDNYGGPGDVPRKLTLILYCNSHAPRGGQLRLRPPHAACGTALDIAPVGGRLVAFFAEEVWHEVLPSEEAERYALTLWVFDREQAEKLGSRGCKDHVGDLAAPGRNSFAECEEDDSGGLEDLD